MKNDTYKTIKTISSGIYKEKGSKFLSFAYPISNEEDFKTIQKKINKEYHDARHRCFAYRLIINDYYRVNDDGEPSNTAGKPILGQILSRELSNILIYIVRYFGGKLLGASGLINAYKTSAADALNKAEIIKKFINDIYLVNFDYQTIGEVMRIINEEKIEQFDQNFTKEGELKIRIRQSNTKKVVEKLNKINKLTLNYLKTD